MREEKHLFETLNSLYQEMDDLWTQTAQRYGFECNGCSENCCETEFYHHTQIEKAYFLYGFKRLHRPIMVMTSKRAKKVNSKRNLAAKKGEQIRIMCPVNLEGKCTLYPYRPMICRLHGIPHEVKLPGGNGNKEGKGRQPGCNAGEELFKDQYHLFDRTPFYSKLAALEKEYCQLNFSGKPERIKQTIAQMLVK